MAHTAHPSYIQYFPTLRCNRSCGFCFMRTAPSCSDVKHSDFLRLIALMHEVGIRDMDILGGEPTLHPRFMEMMDALPGRGISASISTNGTNPRLLMELSRRHPGEDIKVGISLNGAPPSEGLHEFIIKRRPMLKTVYTARKEVPEALGRYAGLEGVECYLIYMDALSGEDLKDTLPFYEFMRDLEGLEEIHVNLSGVFCGFIPRDEGHGSKQPRCPAGTTKLSVLPDGSAYPCYLFFGRREFALGNILRDDFRAIWENPILDYFRGEAGSNCPNSGCTLLGICRGGCPAVSLLVLNDIHQADPRCTFR
jgi:radical SAM protein with 4Fe4S-binding SPASM domain